MIRIQQIEQSDASASSAAKARWDSIAKPLGSFGVLEEMIQKIAAVQGSDAVDISQKKTDKVFF